MTGGPLSAAILGRELRRTSRMRATYLARGLWLALLVAIVGYAWVETSASGTQSIRQISETGRALYVTFFGTVAGLVCLVCPPLMCGALADETADRTLEVLLTTPIGRLPLVLSKFVSRLSMVAMLLVASVPVLIGCLYFGGTAPVEVLVSVLIVLGIAGWVSSLTLVFSALVRRGFVAALLAYAVVGGWTIASMILYAIWSGTGLGGARMLALSSPLFFLGHHLAGELQTLGDAAESIALALALMAAVTAGLLALSARLLGRPLRRSVARDSATRAAPGLAGQALGGLGWAGLVVACAAVVLGVLAVLLPSTCWEGFGTAWLPFLACLSALSWALARGVRGWFFRGRAYQPVWDAPFLWKEVRLEASTTGRVAALGAMGIAAGLGLLLMFDTQLAGNDGPAIFLVDFSFALALLVVSVAGGSGIASEREDGLLDLLLVTPAPAARIVGAKVAGALSQSTPIVLFLLAYAAGGLALDIVKEPAEAALGLVLMGAALHFHATLACVLSLRMRRSTHAILAALAFPLFLYAGWPLLMAIACNGLDNGGQLYVATAGNPFFLFVVLAERSDLRGSLRFPVGPAPTAMLDAVAFTTAALFLRAMAGSRFRAWSGRLAAE